MRRLNLKPTKGLFLTAIAVLGILVVPIATTWGSRGRGPASFQDKLDQFELRKTRQIPRVSAIERPTDLSPFGAAFEPDNREMSPGERRGQVETAIGWVDLRHPEKGVLSRVPQGLRADAAGLRAAGVKGRGHAQGVNLIQLSESALAAEGFDAIEKEVRKYARILDQVPESALVVRVRNERDLDALAALSSVEAIGPYEAAFKLSPRIGRMPLMQTERAHSREMDLVVSLWDDVDSAQGRSAIEQIAGHGKVSPWSIDGKVFQVKGSTQIASRLARDPLVRSLAERPEFMLTNSDAPTQIMLGNTESSFGMSRPYHELGIDGGGLNAAGLPSGVRVNNDTAQVPPQIVTVTDNGISYDAVHFS